MNADVLCARGICYGLRWQFLLIGVYRQIIKSCKTGTAHKSLSLGFLLLWFLSDLANLLGTILTKQLFTQVR